MSAEAVAVAAGGLALLTWPAGTRVPAGARRGERPPAARRGRRNLSIGHGPVRRPVLVLLLGVIVVLVVLGIAAWTRWQLVIAAAIAAATAWRLLRRAKEAARGVRMAAGLLAALRALVRELDAGSTRPQALDHVAQSAPREICRLLDAIDEAALEPRSDEPRTAVTGALSADVDRLVTAWRLSAAHGIPLSVMTSACVLDLEDRIATRALRAQHVAGPAVSGYVLAVLPLAGLAMGAGMGSRPVEVLVSSDLGGMLLCVGVALCCAGLLWTDRIVRGGFRD